MRLIRFFQKSKVNQIELDYLKLPRKSLNNHGLRVIIDYASKSGYTIKQIDYNTGMIRYVRGYEYINFYTTTGTISTEINHPKKGKTQLHRKGLGMNEIKSVFDNPRQHTGKGYYKKSK